VTALLHLAIGGKNYNSLLSSRAERVTAGSLVIYLLNEVDGS